MIAITNPGNWIDRVLKLLDFLGTKQKERALAKDEASKKFREAIIETKIYVSQYEREKVRNYEKEENLSRLWFEAARLIKKSKGESLAKECSNMAFLLLKKELSNANLDNQVSTIFCQGQDEDYAMTTKIEENKLSINLQHRIKPIIK